MNVNFTMVGGRLTKDPELRYTASGQAVCNLNMAVNRSWKTPAGEKREEVLLIRVSVWGKSAEATAQYLAKGSELLVEGHLQLNEWDSETGKKQRIELTGERVHFVGKKGEGE